MEIGLAIKLVIDTLVVITVFLFLINIAFVLKNKNTSSTIGWAVGVIGWVVAALMSMRGIIENR